MSIIVKGQSGYRLLDFEILFGVFKELNCPNSGCDGELKLTENVKNKKDQLVNLVLNVIVGIFKTLFTSQSSCHQSFDVNKRLVYTMRSLGQGYSQEVYVP